jgi:hypothetical protein
LRMRGGADYLAYPATGAFFCISLFLHTTQKLSLGTMFR